MLPFGSATAIALPVVVGLATRYADRAIEIVDPGQYEASTVREHLRVDGEFLVGPSGGGVVQAVRQLDVDGQLAADDEVVTILADRGDKYAEGLWESSVDEATDSGPNGDSVREGRSR